MPLTTSRYDGYADWYDIWNKPHAERNASDVLDLLVPGDGLCLDLGCGSSMRSSARGWQSIMWPSWATGQSRSSSLSAPISRQTG